MRQRRPSRSVLWFAILAVIGIAAYLLWSKIHQLSREPGPPGPAALRSSAATAEGSLRPAPEPQTLTSAAPELESEDVGNCPQAFSYAAIFHDSPSLAAADAPPSSRQRRQRVEVYGSFFPTRPTVEDRALVLPLPTGEAVLLRIVATSQDPETPPPRRWSVELEEASHTSLKDLETVDPARRPEYPSGAVVLWPVPQDGAAIVGLADLELPPGVTAAIVKAAVDSDGDGSADLLVVEFCCGDRSRRNACDYHCGETWQKLGGNWTRCSSWQPA